MACDESKAFGHSSMPTAACGEKSKCSTYKNAQLTYRGGRPLIWLFLTRNFRAIWAKSLCQSEKGEWEIQAIKDKKKYGPKPTSCRPPAVSPDVVVLKERLGSGSLKIMKRSADDLAKEKEEAGDALTTYSPCVLMPELKGHMNSLVEVLLPPQHLVADHKQASVAWQNTLIW